MLTRPSSTRRSIRRNILAGMLVFAVLVGAVGGWAGTTMLSCALIASATIVVDSNLKKVQHPTGEVVAELRVREGDRVKGGDIVARLDQTITRANLAVITEDSTSFQRARRKSSQASGMVRKCWSFWITFKTARASRKLPTLLKASAKVVSNSPDCSCRSKDPVLPAVCSIHEAIVGLTSSGTKVEKLH